MSFEGEDARRWQMIDAPTLSPGVDFVTRSPNGPFLDTGINLTVENRGRVYLSVETIREMAEIAGILKINNAQEKALYDLEIYNRGYEAGLKEGQKIVELLDSVAGRLAAEYNSYNSAGAVASKAVKKTTGTGSGKPEVDPLDI